MFSNQRERAYQKQSAAPGDDTKHVVGPKPLGFLYSPYAWLAVYLLSLNVRLWFNFQTPHMNAYGACDASEYLRNAIALHSLGDLSPSFWQDALSCLFGQASQATVASVRSQLAVLNELKISSPVFPTFLISVFSLTGTAFDTSNWMLMLGAQSFIGALTSVFIARTAALLWDRKVGFAAGILSALYPGFIVNSGRLYSETFAVFLTSLLVLLTVKDFIGANGQDKTANKFFWGCSQVLKGLTAICLQLTRSIMVVATVALIPITILTYWKDKSKTKIIVALALMTLGYASVAMPWLSLQKLAFGTSTLIVDRVGHYNFFVGNNIETQGWLSVPYPDGRAIEEKSLFTLWQEEIKKSPSGWMRLMQDKLPRLLKFPWNDFRTPIGPIGVYHQITIHQLILLFGVIGIVFSLFGNMLQRSRPVQLLCRQMIFSLISFQLVYCFFITVPRYNIAIMPFIIMFAAAGLLGLWRLANNARSAKVAISITAVALFSASRVDSAAVMLPQLAITISKALIFLALAIALWQSSNWLDGNKKKTRALILTMLALLFVPVCLPVRAHGRPSEWQRTITNDQLKQTIAVSQQELADLQNKNCYLLIDSEDQTRLVNDASISINGQPLSGPFIPSLSFANDLSHVVPTGNNSVAFEQEYIFDCLTSEAETSNANLRQWYLVPVPKEILAGIPINNGSASIELAIGAKEKPFTVFGSTASRNKITIPSLTRYSWEKAFYGVENTHGLTDTRYDERLKLSNIKTSQTANLFLLSDAVVDPANQPQTLISATKEGNGVEIKLPSYRQEDLWLVRVTGQTRGDPSKTIAKAPAKAQVSAEIICNNHGKQLIYKSPWCQKLIAADKDWQSFDCAFPIKPSSLPGKALTLKTHFLPVSDLYTHRNTHPDTIAQAEVRNLTMQLIHFPTMPFEGNYNLYLGQDLGQKTK